jgi:hypothetical protein
MSIVLRAASAAVLTLGAAFSVTAHAQTPLISEVRTVAKEAPPVEKSFQIAADAGGEYELSLTDLAFPAPLSAIRLAVTRGSTVVASVDNATSSEKLTLQAGDYVVRVLGIPAPPPPEGGPEGGGFAAQIKRVSNGAIAVDLAGSFVRPSQQLDGRGTIADTFSIATGGNYQVTLSDLQLPAGLPTLTMALRRQGTTNLFTLPAAGTQQFTLPAGDYQVFVAAQASSDIQAGLFSAIVRPAGGGAPVYATTSSIGNVQLLGKVTTGNGPHTVSLSDFAFPASLEQQRAAVARDGAVAAQLSAAGTATFEATAGEYAVYAFAAAAAAAPGSGSYGLEIRQQGGGAIFSAVRAVTNSTNPVTAYTFNVDIAAVGAYRLRLADFEFPGAFQSIGLAAVQGGNVLGSLQAAGSLNVNLTTGPLYLLVFAPPGTAQAGLFGVDVAPAGGGAVLFETTQGVGKLFAARKVAIPAAGRYNVALSDLEFPAKFVDLAAVVTRGTDKLGSLFGGGTFGFQASAGDYIISVIAEGALLDERIATSQQRAGTYAMTVTQAPAAPTVTLSANPTQVRSGESVELTWSSQNATACTASNGWTGTKAASGTERSAALTAATTFTIKCDGAGGSTTQSVSVTMSPSSSRGGGGSLEWLTVLMLVAALGCVAGRKS